MSLVKMKEAADRYLKNHIGPSFMSAVEREQVAHDLAIRALDLLAEIGRLNRNSVDPHLDLARIESANNEGVQDPNDVSDLVHAMRALECKIEQLKLIGLNGWTLADNAARLSGDSGAAHHANLQIERLKS